MRRLPPPLFPLGAWPARLTETRRQCGALRSSSVRANVYLPGGEAYEARLGGYWSAGAALSPWCMAVPETTEHVSTIITTLTRHQCPFGVKGGGHAAWPLANGVDEGVTIDFGTGTARAQRQRAERIPLALPLLLSSSSSLSPSSR